MQLQTSGCEKHQRGRVSRTSVRSPQWPLRLFPDAHPTPPPAFQKGFGVSFPSPYKVIPVSLQGSIEWLDGPLIHWLDMDWEFDRKINPAFDCSALSLTVCMPPKGDTAGCVRGHPNCVFLAPKEQPHAPVCWAAGLSSRSERTVPPGGWKGQAEMAEEGNCFWGAEQQPLLAL